MQEDKEKKSKRVANYVLPPLVYPPINPKRFREVDTIENSILPRILDDVFFFSPRFRERSEVMEAITKKYEALGYPNPEEEDMERFLIGTSRIGEAWKDSSCPFFLRAKEQIEKDSTLKHEKILAIHLLGEDRSDENRQRFIALTIGKIFFRGDNPDIEEYNLENVIFLPDGILLKPSYQYPTGYNLISYSFDESFYRFAREVILLRAMKFFGIRKRHPFADMEPERKHAYIEFLTDTAVAEGRATAPQILRLEYLAKDFHVSEDDLASMIKHHLHRPFGVNKLSERLGKVLPMEIASEQSYVFYQDILELSLNDDGEMVRTALKKILDRSFGFAGKEFTDGYLDYVREKRKAEQKLEETYGKLKAIKGGLFEENLPNLYEMLLYYGDLSVQYLETGVNLYGNE